MSILLSQDGIFPSRRTVAVEEAEARYIPAPVGAVPVAAAGNFRVKYPCKHGYFSKRPLGALLAGIGTAVLFFYRKDLVTLKRESVFL